MGGTGHERASKRPHLRTVDRWNADWGALALMVEPAKADDKRTVDNFRTKCLRELRKIKLAWPGLNYATAPTTGPQRLVE